jgi:hypothetical protein
MACWNPFRCEIHGPYRGRGGCPECLAEELEAEGVYEWECEAEQPIPPANIQHYRT